MANYTFGQLLDLLMLNQEDAAKELEVSEFTISRWVLNKVTMRKPNRRKILRTFGPRLKDHEISADNIIWPSRAALYMYEYKVHNPNARAIQIKVAGKHAMVPAKGERTITYEAAEAHSVEPELYEGDLPLLLRAWRGNLVVAAPTPTLTEEKADDDVESGDQGDGDRLPKGQIPEHRED